MAAPGNNKPISNAVISNENYTNILNLSKLDLTPAMLSVLNEGLSFCPSTSEPEYSNCMSGLENLLRQMRISAFFNRFHELSNSSDSSLDSNLSQTETQPQHTLFDHYKFKDPSSFEPKADNQTVLRSFCTSVTRDVYTSPIRKFSHHNLLMEEQLALKALASNPDIVIKPADKGRKIVIQDTPTYIREVKNHLSDPKSYCQVGFDLTETHNRQVKQLVAELLHREAISDKVASFLTFERPRTAQLYMLPKIH